MNVLEEIVDNGEQRYNNWGFIIGQGKTKINWHRWSIQSRDSYYN